MWIGIDDTDSSRGMCTTYLAALLAARLEDSAIEIQKLRLVRLNPNVVWKTRGNAAIAIQAEGDVDVAFALAADTIHELADLACEETNPGLVVSTDLRPPSWFAEKAITGFCTVEEAIAVCEDVSARYTGWKNKRGLIGATAAIAAIFMDSTSEILVYRSRDRCGSERQVDQKSLYRADEATVPHTWDTVDRENQVIVCIPHTPDPVLFGIRGEDPVWVSLARNMVRSELAEREAVFETNQGTDAHLLLGSIGFLEEGRSYIVFGVVAQLPVTGEGGHVSVRITDSNHFLTCMAFEPTKGFRDIIRALMPGDRVAACGSYKRNALNLEKLQVITADPIRIKKPPICMDCDKRMTSAGAGKGYKCRLCNARSNTPSLYTVERSITPGWYEPPPSARRHLARPLCRGPPSLVMIHPRVVPD